VVSSGEKDYVYKNIGKIYEPLFGNIHARMRSSASDARRTADKVDGQFKER